MFEIGDGAESKTGFYVSYLDKSNGRRFYLASGKYIHNWIDEKARAWLVPESQIDGIVSDVLRCYPGSNFLVEPA